MKRVFLSFRAEDKNRVNGVRLLAANPKFDLEFYDESVRVAYDSTNADYIKRQIRDKISRTSVTLALLSELTHTSRWVDWEIEESYQNGNTVICMGFPNGPGHLHVPAPAKQRGHNWWLWDLDKLTQLIESAPPKWI